MNDQDRQDRRRWALVLSGGGARGAYQYGAWQVLRKTPLKDQLLMMAGTSIGAINTVLFVQQEITGEPLPELFWEKADLSAIFSIFPPGKTHLAPLDYLQLGWDGIRHQGIRIDALKDWLKQHVNLNVLAKAPLHMAVNTWDIGRFQEVVKFFPAADPKDDLLEWVIGSASFPAFGPHHYQGRWLLDGGISNNLPLHLAFGYQAVAYALAIDLATFMRLHPRQLWLERKYRRQTHFLRVPIGEPSPLAFSRPALDRLIAQGKADAKTWWQNGGHSFAASTSR